ncbi:MAG: histidine phosphatase family protein [Cyanomargarita calcarea GSE-NOS-MK-12-04C]|jgi:broad specificity phosphatase PhoE|uniref:Histidine phosphatase family protein n=1 Tax=Cyanomargarita calcarea GSE-NOS-MK-12-04C TaxID=2839659 RepID=A0A951QRX3_9CYAN|nr:histidine phosphatase family protein [Cyanomargarita calcarea GSE-NOS-MK-12-04C]
MQTIWIARHGNRQDYVDRNWRRTALKPFDPSLSADGAVQAQKLAGRLVGEKIRHIFASPAFRTLETANYTAEALNLPIKIEAGLSEWSNFIHIWYVRLDCLWGHFRQTSVDSKEENPRNSPGSILQLMPETSAINLLLERFPRIDTSYTSSVVPKRMETWFELRERGQKTIRHLAENYPEDILIISHTSAIRPMVAGLVNNSPPINCPLCSLIKLVETDDKWIVELNGDTKHLTNHYY